MSDIPTSSDAAHLLTHLAKARPGHHVQVEGRELPAEIALLRALARWVNKWAASEEVGMSLIVSCPSAGITLIGGRRNR